MKIYFTILFLFFSISAICSMRFYIVPDKKSACKGELTSGFSDFLQGGDAFGETSEYERICNAIKMNLEIFQERAVTYEDVSRAAWIKVDLLTAVIQKYLTAISKIRHIESLVDYDPRKKARDSMYAKILRSSFNSELQVKYNKLDSAIMNDESHPFYLMPPDRGYLSQKKLHADLQSILKILRCYKNSGISKVRIVYM